MLPLAPRIGLGGRAASVLISLLALLMGADMGASSYSDSTAVQAAVVTILAAKVTVGWLAGTVPMPTILLPPRREIQSIGEAAAQLALIEKPVWCAASSDGGRLRLPPGAL